MGFCYSLSLPVQYLVANLIWVYLFVSYKGNYVACLIAMLQLMDEKHYQKYVAHFPTDQELLVSFNSWKLVSFGITSAEWSVIAFVCIVLKFFLRKMLITFVLNEGVPWFGMKGVVNTASMAKWLYAVVYNSMYMGICTIVPVFLKPWCDRKLMMNFKPGEYMRIRTWYWSAF